jgi:hypothetical protein
MNSRLKRVIRRALRNTQGDDHLVSRAGLRDRIAELSEHGQVAISVRQMDCDCYVWTSCRTVPATVMHVVVLMEGIWDNAEGPVQWTLIRPSERYESHGEDLAMAAYEDGHAHSVTF